VEHITPIGGRTIEEATQILWKIIDEAKTALALACYTSKEEEPKLTVVQR